MAFLEQPLNRLQLAYARSGVPVFLQWWRDELVGLLPDRVRNVVAHDVEKLVIRLQDDALAYSREQGTQRTEIYQHKLSSDAKTDGSNLATELVQFERTPPLTTLLVEGEAVLRKRIAVPMAAEDNLASVLGFEMDRHTPFARDDVMFDFVIRDRLTEKSQLDVELLVLPKASLAPLLDAVRKRNIAIDRVDIETEDGVAGVNFLPVDERPKRVNKRLRINIALSVVAVGLLYAVMWQSINAREQALAQYQEKVKATQQEAREVRGLMDQLDEARDAATFLSDQRSSTPHTIEILRDVTRLLPDDTYLQRLDIRDGMVRVQGLAPEHTALIPALAESRYLRPPETRGSVGTDPRTGKERFTLESKIVISRDKASQQEDSDGSAARQG